MHPIGQGRFLVTERVGRLAIIEDRKVRRLQMPTDLVWASGETGLMGLAIDPTSAGTAGSTPASGGHTRAAATTCAVVAWRLNAAATRARRTDVPRSRASRPPAVGTAAAGCSSPRRLAAGRHRRRRDGSNPARPRVLGGKTLRLNRITGAPVAEQPVRSTRQHAQRTSTPTATATCRACATAAAAAVWSAEHGPDRDDEVNLLTNGGDYGWNPVPGYNEFVPMTDQGLPGKQIAAAWSSGIPTVATSGRLASRQEWGCLRRHPRRRRAQGQRVVFMKFDADGNLVARRTPAALTGYGRLRSISRLPNGDLMITTANGGGDAVLRVRPAG